MTYDFHACHDGTHESHIYHELRRQPVDRDNAGTSQFVEVRRHSQLSEVRSEKYGSALKSSRSERHVEPVAIILICSDALLFVADDFDIRHLTRYFRLFVNRVV